MAITPASFFNFAAEHVELLRDIFYRTREERGVSEADLLGLIRRHAKPGDPAGFRVLERMQELGFVESAPDATARFTLSVVFAALMAQVLQEYRTTSVEVIQGYLSSFQSLARELDEADAAAGGSTRAVRALMELEQNIERLRQDSRSNRDAILVEVLRTKTAQDREPARKRYERINWLWTRYMIPLRDLIDTRKAMDQALDDLDRSLRDAGTRFVRDGAVARVLAGLDARLLRLRRSVTDDYRESLTELRPLYEELRQECAVARGASLALERFSREGGQPLRLGERLAVCSWRLQGLFDDDALRGALLDIRGYRPAPPSPIACPVPPARLTDVLSASAFDAAVQTALPIEDALAWLIHFLGVDSPARVLRGYGRLRIRPGVRLRFRPTPRDYALRDLTLRACPMGVEPAAAATPT